jgi:hypothetical protein
MSVHSKWINQTNERKKTENKWKWFQTQMGATHFVTKCAQELVHLVIFIVSVSSRLEDL